MPDFCDCEPSYEDLKQMHFDSLKRKLSIDLIIACEIYHNNTNGQPVWFTRLCEVFEGLISKNDVNHSLDTLSDWIVIYGEYGETKSGYGGYRYFIDKDAKYKIEELYNKYYAWYRRSFLKYQ